MIMLWQPYAIRIMCTTESQSHNHYYNLVWIYLGACLVTLMNSTNGPTYAELHSTCRASRRAEHSAACRMRSRGKADGRQHSWQHAPPQSLRLVQATASSCLIVHHANRGTTVSVCSLLAMADEANSHPSRLKCDEQQ